MGIHLVGGSMSNIGRDCVPDITKAFHEAYEELAPRYKYETRKESKKPWDQVPEQNKRLMEATVRNLFIDGHLRIGPVYEKN